MLALNLQNWATEIVLAIAQNMGTLGDCLACIFVKNTIPVTFEILSCNFHLFCSFCVQKKKKKKGSR